MLVDCPRCKALVDGKEISEYIGLDEDIDFEIRYCFMNCPVCNEPLLTKQWRPDPNEIWDSPRRLYPPRRRVSVSVPKSLRRSFQEALGCKESGHYLATALMCRRIVEGICKDHLGTIPNLAKGLKALHENNIIDDRLIEWSSALREDGNLAAHDLDAKITSEDATDLVDFAEAILDYVYVLRDRFEKYKSRRAQEIEKSAARKQKTRKSS
jgi:hypothetical protein